MDTHTANTARPAAPAWVISADESAMEAAAAVEALDRADVPDPGGRVQAHADRAAAAADAAAAALCQAEGVRHARRAEANKRSAVRLALRALAA